ncbi:hypothetical protein Patl1_15133 [Pistacia atlantica]|uniref:Uncharacterized protein n=1 Tax=Pistacia atlantica TaxID=434234 RepID=A0ACC1BBB2_9ROSI|nr:hypothetical protein Patl1_15133 [Pistacia atlantica]
MSLVLSTVFFLLLPYLEARNITSDGNSDQIAYEFCKPKFCSPEGPQIRFPFRLKAQSNLCGLEGFELSCFENKTLLHLPFASDYYVHNISYVDSRMTIMDVHETPCTLESLHSPNLSNSRFFPLSDSRNYTILNCTERTRFDFFVEGPFDCFSDKKNLVYATSGNMPIDYLPSTCKISETFSIPTYLSQWRDDDAMKAFEARTIDIKWKAFEARTIDIKWQALDGCYECEKSGKYCGLNTTSNSIICVNRERK